MWPSMLVCTGSHTGGRPQAGTATCRASGCQKRGLFTPWDRWTPAGTVTVFLNTNPRCVFLEIKKWLGGDTVHGIEMITTILSICCIVLCLIWIKSEGAP